LVKEKKPKRTNGRGRKASTPKHSYPHITRNPNICGGEPTIEDTRTTVRAIASYYQTGMTADEILSGLPHLSLSKVHSALAYYFDNKKEIDALIHLNADYDYWKKKAVVHPKLKAH
ncbi:MAG: DUF433 domain-containing protein, partial [Bacteroidota bacterium]